MQARVAREGEVLIVYLSGRMDVETAEPFRIACSQHLTGKKIVFDFRHVSFVGSSGILPVLEILQDFAKRNASGVKFSGVGSEFRRVFAATPLETVEIFEDPKQAAQAYLRPVGAFTPPVTPLSEVKDSQVSAGASGPQAYGYLSFKHQLDDESPLGQHRGDLEDDELG